ncbi:hypothetical protein BYT27DRAFT_7216504 [Phlegmacium glaucopus]|nr:hypothetical protein BYT27DRAFT_7216504 [Phlegmacium glaucopus]
MSKMDGLNSTAQAKERTLSFIKNGYINYGGRRYFAQLKMPRKTPILHSKRVTYYTLMGRLYQYDKGKPFFFKIITQDDQQAKLEQAGGAFRENGRIYYFRVAVLEGSKRHEFQLSCKGGSALPTNQTLQQIGKAWRGDIFVMHIGKRDPQDLVNMGGCDARQVDFAVKNKSKAEK